MTPGVGGNAEYWFLSPQTPDRAAERITGSGNLPAGRDSYRGPSGRHEATGASDEITVDMLRSWLAYQDALAIRRAEMRYAHALLRQAVAR